MIAPDAVALANSPDDKAAHEAVAVVAQKPLDIKALDLFLSNSLQVGKIGLEVLAYHFVHVKKYSLNLSQIRIRTVHRHNKAQLA